MFLIADLFTRELVTRGCALNVDPVQSLAKGRIGRRAAVLFIADRSRNEVFMRGCIRVVLNIGSLNRAFETAGW
jgi:hypothetical protein